MHWTPTVYQGVVDSKIVTIECTADMGQGLQGERDCRSKNVIAIGGRML